MDSKEFQKVWGMVVARAWSDEAFKKRLLSDPSNVLKENGISISGEVTVKVVEDSAKVIHLILPNKPAELSDEELDHVAGGIGGSPYILPDFPVGANKVGIKTVRLEHEGWERDDSVP